MSHRPHENENLLDNPHAPPVERQYYSIGFLSGMLQQSSPKLLAIAKAANVEVAMCIDGVAYFRGDGFKQMMQHVERTLEDRASSN